MVQAPRRYRSPCRLCGRVLGAGERAAKLLDSKGHRHPGLHLRFWLCARCADKVEQAIDAMRTRPA